MGRHVQDISGMKFGRLTVVRRWGRTPSQLIIWLCVCECGNETKALAGNLKGGNVRSCGCLPKDIHTKHGRSNDYIFRLWHHVIDRCYDPTTKYYELYGGRGIGVYQPWHDATTFIKEVIAEIGERPKDKCTIDRIDTNKGYEPGNIRWASYKEQANNKRTNHRLTHNGETLTVSQWSERTGFGEGMIRRRLKLGFTVEETLTLPRQKNQFV